MLYNNKQSLIEQIENTRQELYKLMIENEYNLTNDDVLKVSKKLDSLLNYYFNLQ